MNTEKKPPGWATVVGILGICFGALGLLGGGYELMMPMIMSMQQKMMDSVKESMKNKPPAADCREAKPCPKPDASAAAAADAGLKMFDDFMSVPPWYERFAYINGGLQLLLAALYILASVFLLLLKRGAATFFLCVAAVSAVRNLAAVGIGLSAGSFLTFWSVASGASGFLIDLVLAIVVLVSDRSMYRPPAVTA